MQVLTLKNIVPKLQTSKPIVNTPIYRSERKWEKFELHKDITVELSNRDVLTIPKGFKHDKRSSWKISNIISPQSDSLIGYIIHDYLYRTSYKSEELGLKKARKFADDEMYKWAKATSKNKLSEWISYYAVRLGGRGVYKDSHKEIKNSNMLNSKLN